MMDVVNMQQSLPASVHHTQHLSLHLRNALKVKDMSLILAAWML